MYFLNKLKEVEMHVELLRLIFPLESPLRYSLFIYNNPEPQINKHKFLHSLLISFK